jgi:hypothetical protein
MAFSDIPEVLVNYLESDQLEIEGAYSLLNFFNSSLLASIEAAFNTAHTNQQVWLLFKVVNAAAIQVARNREGFLESRQKGD